MTISHICGSFLIQAYGSFLNGAGNIKIRKGEISVPKSYELAGIDYPYISAQCWRRLWKESYISEMQNIDLKKTKEIKYINKPFINPIDDIFGYFEGIDESINIEDINKVNISQIRSSPFQISQLHPIEKFGDIYGKAFSQDDGYIHLRKETPLPYSSRFYSSNLQSLISIDLNRIGRYKNFNDRQELAEKFVQEYIKKNLLIEKEPDLYELADIEILKSERIIFLMKSLFSLSGGAKSTQYGTNITPQIIIIAGQNGANPILSNIFEIGYNKVAINIDRFVDHINKFSYIFETPIFLGIRSGFIENLEDLIRNKDFIQNKTGKDLIISSPLSIIEFFEGFFNYES